MATGYHTDKLWMAFVRKWANCDDFHSLTACVHMSIRRAPCGITICNSRLIWLLELETMPGQGFWQGKLHWWDPWQVQKVNHWVFQIQKKRADFAKLWQRRCDFSLSCSSGEKWFCKRRQCSWTIYSWTHQFQCAICVFHQEEMKSQKAW